MRLDPHFLMQVKDFRHKRSPSVQFSDCTMPICYSDTIGEKTGDGVKQKYEKFLDWKDFSTAGAATSSRTRTLNGSTRPAGVNRRSRRI